MPRLTQAPNLIMATLWSDWLRAEGIDASVQREYLRSAAGELPPDQCLPEVWIQDASQATRAREVLRHLQRVPQRRWVCACGQRTLRCHPVVAERAGATSLRGRCAVAARRPQQLV